MSQQPKPDDTFRIDPAEHQQMIAFVRQMAAAGNERARQLLKRIEDHQRNNQ